MVELTSGMPRIVVVVVDELEPLDPDVPDEPLLPDVPDEPPVPLVPADPDVPDEPSPPLAPSKFTNQLE